MLYKVTYIIKIYKKSDCQAEKIREETLDRTGFTRVMR
jgi:hypothetical protein